MKLSDVEILPGVIALSKDPKNKGRVKAYVPTLFEPETDVETLPWIYPFHMPGYQYYSRMKDGAMIWVINNTTNYNEYWYVPFFKLNNDTQEIADKGDDVDILFDRNEGGGSSRIYYTPDDGIKSEIGEYYSQLFPDGVYKINGASDKGINIESGKVQLGNTKGGTTTSVVRFDKFYEAFNDFCTSLSANVGSSLSAASCGAAAAGTQLNQAASKLQKALDDMKSEVVEIIEN